MPTTASLILTGVGLGLGAAVPLGPVNVEIARRTIRHGVATGIALGCGAVTIDVIFAILASLGVSRLMDRPFLRWPLVITGIVICLWLAFLNFRSAWRATRQAVSENVDAPAHKKGLPLVGTYAVGFAMTGLNAYTWLWWFTAVPSIAGTLTDNPTHDLPMICLGVGVAALTWVLVFASALGLVRHFAGRTFHVVADAIGGVMLLGFGLLALWKSIGRPL